MSASCRLSPPGDEHASHDLDVLDLVRESVIVFDIEGRVTTWNAAAERLYGWRRPEAVGAILKTLVQCVPSTSLKRIKAKLCRTGTWESEVRRTAKDGTRVVVRARWSLRRDRNGDPLDVVETSVDITAARHTEEALKQAEYQYSNLFQAMAASFWELDFSEVGRMVRELSKLGVRDLEGYFAQNPAFVRRMIQATRIRDVNEQTVTLFGRGDKQELLEDLGRFWPEESVPIFAASVLAAVEGRPFYSHETKFVALDGREVDTLFTACFPPEMLARGMLLIGIIDISAANKAKRALESSERRYRNLFQFMPIPVWQLDSGELVDIFKGLKAAGVIDLKLYIDAHPEFVEQAMDALRVVEVNGRTTELLGARDAQEIYGPVTRFWRESPDVFRRAVEACFLGAAEHHEQIKLPTLDGRSLDALFAHAFFWPPNDMATSLVALIDISDRVRAQGMLAQVQSEFAHASRVSMLGELTASIAHEVNQPLAAIITNGEASLRWLDRPEPDVAEVRALTVYTVADARRAADVIGRIRDMVVRTGTKPAPTAINKVIEEAVLFLRHEFQRLETEVLLDLAVGLPDLPGDRVQLQQVVVNLALNAVQAMAQSAGKPRRLTLRTALADAQALRVEVEDTGPGIPAENIDLLFDSFFTTKPDGMGIGLPICRSIIEAHGGRIAVANLPSLAGAKVTFTLPVLEEST